MSKILVLSEHSLSDQVASHVERSIGRADLDRVYVGKVPDLVGELRHRPERYDFAVLPSTYTQGCEYTLSLLFDIQEGRQGVEIVGCVPVVPSLYLWGLPGATLDGIRTVCSQIEALCSCRAPLRRLGVAHAEFGMTHAADAAREVAARGQKNLAALASRKAGEAYGLVRLMEESLNPRSVMPFFVLGHEPVSFASAYNRTMVAIHNDPDLVLPALRLDLDLDRVTTVHGDGADWMVIQLRGDLQTGTVRSQVRRIEQIAGDRYHFLGSYWMWDPILV